MTYTLESSSSDVRTFLIADIRGYTSFTLEHGDEAAARLAASFAGLARKVVAARDGAVIELRGDEVLAVFGSARQALRAAIELQERLADATITDPSLPIKVGIGLDAGEAVPVEGGYRGAALNLAARLCSLAGPGEVLASDGVTHLARKVEGLHYAERGAVQLKGFAESINVIRIVPAAALTSLTEPGNAWVSDRPLPIGGFLGSLPSTVLVAREKELKRIRGIVDAVLGGAGRLVLLAGEPGSGKTRLAQEVTLLVRNQEFLVAAGVSYEPRQSVPYYPFLDLLAALFEVAPPDIRTQIPRRWPYLGRLLPEAGIVAPGAGSDGHEEQERLFRAITGFVQTVAEKSPVALLLDDLQWADSSSLELLQHLARHTRGQRVLLLGTYRDVEVGRQHPLEHVLLDLHREGLTERIDVRRMDQEGTAAMIATTLGQGDVSSELSQLVHRNTEGNPFFTQEVLRALVDRGDIYREDGHWERREIDKLLVPESVRSAIGARLSRLSNEVQETLCEACVLGHSFTFQDLQAMGSQAEDDLETALEEATAAGLIREVGRDTYDFNHALTQQALYAELSGRRKRRLHLAAGTALERLLDRRSDTRRVSGTTPTVTTRAAELAWHFLEADDPQRALRYSMLAGDQAESLFARQEATRHYRTALELARETSNQEYVAEALFKLGQVLFMVDAMDEALALLDEAAEGNRTLGNSLIEARTLVTAAHICGTHRDRKKEAQQRIERAENLLLALDQMAPTPDLVHLYRELGYYYFSTGRYSDQLALVDRAMTIARILQNDRLIMEIQVWRLLPLAMIGNLQEVRRESEELIPRTEAEDNLDALGRVLSYAAEVATLNGDFEQSLKYRERELAVSEQLGSSVAVGFVLSNLAWLKLLRGEWQTVRDHCERSLAILQPLDISWGSSFPLDILGKLALWEGDWERACRLLEQCINLARPRHDLQLQRSSQRSLAELDLFQGRPEAAVARLEPLLDRSGLQEHDVTALLPVLAWAHLELPRQPEGLQQAEQIIANAIGRAAAHQNRLVLADALRIQGMVLTRRQRWNEAGAAFEEAISLSERMPYPYAQARTLYEYALMHRLNGRPELARQRLTAALAIFRRLGARRDTERVEQALAV